MCQNKKQQSRTHLTVVKESSRNHGTFILYTLGSLSADRTRLSFDFKRAHEPDCASEDKLTFMNFTLACDCDPERLIDLKTQSRSDYRDRTGTETLSETSRWGDESYLVKVLQLDGVKKPRRVHCNIADSQTWKTTITIKESVLTSSRF